jgi:hypothetical protein
MAWTDEKRAAVIAEYVDIMNTEYKTDAERAAASVEVVKELSEKYGETSNGTRMILSKANVYVKKTSTDTAAEAKTKATGTARISKEDAIATLRNHIAAIDPALIDEEILSKLTGKAAAYFTTIFTSTKFMG